MSADPKSSLYCLSARKRNWSGRSASTTRQATVMPADQLRVSTRETRLKPVPWILSSSHRWLLRCVGALYVLGRLGGGVPGLGGAGVGVDGSAAAVLAGRAPQCTSADERCALGCCRVAAGPSDPEGTRSTAQSTGLTVRSLGGEKGPAAACGWCHGSCVLRPRRTGARPRTKRSARPVKCPSLKDFLTH